MTRDELDSATDEQLDVMAAPLMGWKITVDQFGRTVNEQGWCIGYDWSPATDIADADELVEMLDSKDFQFSLHRRYLPDGKVWHAQFLSKELREWRMKLRPGVTFMDNAAEYTHPNKCRAITTAALLAWQEKENKQ